MKFDRDKLEEEVLEKVKEVNEESGYRPYFELPEYVDIIVTIMEDKFRVEYDDLVNQIHLLSKELDKAQIKAEILEEQLLEEFAETTLTAWENYLNKISDAILTEGKSHETQSNE